MIVVAGHLCLDVIPLITEGAQLEPGRLVEVGPSSFSTGGAVANVGLALARLGVRPSLVGRVGDDPFGEILRSKLGTGPDGAARGGGISVAAGEATSYSIVINRPGYDRTFLHHPGCNDTFSAKDLMSEKVRGAELIHFGYPPLMRRIHEDGGEALAQAFARLREQGTTVALDMAMPDPNGPSGRIDWQSFLSRVLPNVDLFLPSMDEISVMLGSRPDAASLLARSPASVAERLLAAGPAIVGLKLGEQGLYFRTASADRVSTAGRCSPPPSWADRELLSPNFRVEVSGTTGAGDATIAGLLAALTHALPVEEALSVASAVGACSVEGVDAVGGVRSWEETRERIARGWERLPSELVSESGWRLDRETGVFAGPNDLGGNG